MTVTATEESRAELVTLITAAQTGDVDAQGRLYERFQPTVFALAMRRVGDWYEAEELAQEVFIQAFRRLDQLRVPEAFGGWLRQIVHRMAINRLTRKGAGSTVQTDSLDALCGTDDSPVNHVIRGESSDEVHSGLERLGQMDRETLQAFYLNGHSLIEMAEAFDAPVGTIKRRLHVARKRLAKEFGVEQAV